jgi:predicted flap endonuclease-1-like 5' DNA nuclease
MSEVQIKNAPQLWGWTVAAGVGAVGFGAAFGPIGLSSAGAVLVAGVLFAAVGLILGMPDASEDVPSVPAKAHAPVAVAAPAAVVAPEPAPVVVPAPSVAAPARPQGLAAARGGKADDLKLIKGIGPKLEVLCHKLGYYHFDQIAAWTPAEIAWVDDNLEGFKGRVTRDEWVAQARALAAGGNPA